MSVCPASGNIGLLSSRSSSQQRFKFQFVCPDTFWIAEPVVTKLGMVIHHHEPKCQETNWDAFFKVKVTVSSLHMVTQYHKSECHLKEGVSALKVKVKIRADMIKKKNHFYFIFGTADLFVIIMRRDLLWKGCCVESQALYWMFGQYLLNDLSICSQI